MEAQLATHMTTENHLALQLTQVVAQSTVSSLEQSRMMTQVAGLGAISANFMNIESDAFVATATTIAQLQNWQPVIEIFDGVEMVQVPSGCFIMGSAFFADEQPISEICFENAFWIDRFEVSRQQYADCVEDDVCGQMEDSFASTDPSQPINFVSWVDAFTYCTWRDARLPTEAEWEYAARGVDSRPYPWGNDFEPTYVVYFDNSLTKSGRIGERSSGISWVGAHDMSGNIWEWVSTIYDTTEFPYPYDANDGREDLERRDVLRGIRGGSFRSSQDSLRTSNREGEHPFFSSNSIGIRCARHN